MEETNYITYLANHPDPDLEFGFLEIGERVDLDAVAYDQWVNDRDAEDEWNDNIDWAMHKPAHDEWED